MMQIPLEKVADFNIHRSAVQIKYTSNNKSNKWHMKYLRGMWIINKDAINIWNGALAIAVPLISIARNWEASLNTDLDPPERKNKKTKKISPLLSTAFDLRDVRQRPMGKPVNPWKGSIGTVHLTQCSFGRWGLFIWCWCCCCCCWLRWHFLISVVNENHFRCGARLTWNAGRGSKLLTA